ncbi:MarR family transcriptional regulator, partial [Candidatus Bathyarchaeota archaeon]|nr:MarR family transcriptional regulator [Candidatus Bathyarchaeota archaeon]
MSKSKLQISIQILCSLSSNGSMKLEEIADIVELNKIHLMERLGLLYESGLVGENYLAENKKAYFVTERGLTVL